MTCRKIEVPNSGNIESCYLRKFWDVTLREEGPLCWIPQPEVTVIIEIDPDDAVPMPWPRATDLKMPAI